ncbi:Hypothetical predicted protein [Pelobates cultripes]|uniref:Uncharacterized protein n=1 Tax=Pelobates cultripes TaxID=61616 RepID=A0AAD1RMM9_PELCU|nr:Hypothetical predicted protein [Pelobates cultripes]
MPLANLIPDNTNHRTTQKDETPTTKHLTTQGRTTNRQDTRSYDNTKKPLNNHIRTPIPPPNSPQPHPKNNPTQRTEVLGPSAL